MSVKLLNHFQIKKPLVSYHEHNHVTAGQAILRRLLAGESCALVTDAGTPGHLRPRRGPGAAVRGERRGGPRRPRLLRGGERPGGQRPAHGAVHLRGVPARQLKEAGGSGWSALLDEERTMVFPRGAPQAAAPRWGTCGPPSARTGGSPCAGKLTKLHEETRRTTLGGGGWPSTGTTPPRGSIVLVVAGRPPRETAARHGGGRRGEQVLAAGGRGGSPAEGCRPGGWRRHTGLSKNELYAAALARRLTGGPG